MNAALGMRQKKTIPPDIAQAGDCPVLLTHSLELKQSPAFRPFMWELVIFAKVTRWACQNNIIHIMPGTRFGTTQRDRVLNVINTLPIFLLKLLSTVVAGISLHFQFGLYLLRGKNAGNCFLDCLSFQPACMTLQFVCLVPLPLIGTSFFSMPLIRSFVSFTGFFWMRFFVSFIGFAHFLWVISAILTISCIDLILMKQVILSLSLSNLFLMHAFIFVFACFTRRMQITIRCFAEVFRSFRVNFITLLASLISLWGITDLFGISSFPFSSRANQTIRIQSIVSVAVLAEVLRSRGVPLQTICISTLFLWGILGYSIHCVKNLQFLASRLGCYQYRWFEHRYGIARQNHIQIYLYIISQIRSTGKFMLYSHIFQTGAI